MASNPKNVKGSPRRVKGDSLSNLVDLTYNVRERTGRDICLSNKPCV